MTVNLNLLATLALATALFFVGQLIVARSALLQRYSIPVPVVGGFLFAVALALAGLVTPVQFTMNESLKDPLLLAFFATLGLGADVRSLARGGRKLAILLVLFVLLMLLQNAVGISMARLLDLHPRARGSVVSPVVYRLLADTAKSLEIPYSIHAAGRFTSTDAAQREPAAAL